MSLLETLVVIAIIGVALTLVLSGVQRVRGAAVRARCQNNLRQIGLAAQNHHAAVGHFPVGVTDPSDPREPYPYMTWMVRLTPYLEQNAVWDEAVRAFRSQPDFQIDPVHANRALSMAAFACPLDARVASPAVFPLKSGGEKLYGLTSYVGVEGTNSTRADGLLHFGIARRMADVSDGASSTLLVGERPPSFDLHFGWWYAGEGMERNGSVDSVLGARTRCRRPNYCGSCGDDPARFQAGAFDDKCSMLHFWSPHAGGANFAFADGSVRFLSYSADDILPALATRAGGETVAVPD